jgi:hypothetical protein
LSRGQSLPLGTNLRVSGELERENTTATAKRLTVASVTARTEHGITATAQAVHAATSVLVIMILPASATLFTEVQTDEARPNAEVNPALFKTHESKLTYCSQR